MEKFDETRGKKKWAIEAAFFISEKWFSYREILFRAGIFIIFFILGNMNERDALRYFLNQFSKIRILTL